jgi:DNA-binding MarR family transcriptional regulator
MEVERGNTIKFIREKRKASQKSKDQLKTFTKIKKAILETLNENGEMTIPQLAEKLSMTTSDTVYYLMSLLKYGLVETAGLDDMDEYYYYKVKIDGKN